MQKKGFIIFVGQVSLSGLLRERRRRRSCAAGPSRRRWLAMAAMESHHYIAVGEQHKRAKENLVKR